MVSHDSKCHSIFRSIENHIQLHIVYDDSSEKNIMETRKINHLLRWSSKVNSIHDLRSEGRNRISYRLKVRRPKVMKFRPGDESFDRPKIKYRRKFRPANNFDWRNFWPFWICLCHTCLFSRPMQSVRNVGYTVPLFLKSWIIFTSQFCLSLDKLFKMSGYRPKSLSSITFCYTLTNLDSWSWRVFQKTIYSNMTQE